MRRSLIHGRGLFATADVEAGATLDTGSLLVISAEESGGEVLSMYVFELSNGDGGLLLGPSSLCNHAENPNAEVFLDETSATYELTARIAIPAGTEIFIDYGPGYW